MNKPGKNRGERTFSWSDQPTLFMTARCEIARKRVPREAYLVSRMRRYSHTLSVLRFTRHERRFTRKSNRSAIAAEAFMSNAGQGNSKQLS